MPWMAACQALQSMGFPRQEHWSGLPFSHPEDPSWPRDWTHTSCISCTGRQIPYHCTTWKGVRGNRREEWNKNASDVEWNTRGCNVEDQSRQVGAVTFWVCCWEITEEKLKGQWTWTHLDTSVRPVVEVKNHLCSVVEKPEEWLEATISGYFVEETRIESDWDFKRTRGVLHFISLFKDWRYWILFLEWWG